MTSAPAPNREIKRKGAAPKVHRLPTPKSHFPRQKALLRARDPALSASRERRAAGAKKR